MASESGRPLEFADDAHFWPEEDSSVENQMLWMASHTKNERMPSMASRTADKYMLYITDFNGKQIPFPVTIKKGAL